ncbi:methyltransferase [Olivibacter ginsenosidimutans]|uniref:tRNA1(Val) (adenine(37)-N6)-methyltransferase n=1 Tax=Olivibacter ginsenosidimutans TaxID=1176537 RepID=A0ABP9AYK2_9SPHI
MSTIFRFKQFEIDQEGSAMKINTDGILLGALVEKKDPVHILDIGTGTGVIAMMLAQRYPKAIIDAIEIDEPSFMLSKKNFEQSIFSERVFPHHGAFQHFHPTKSYDLIISNPPFFLQALQNTDRRKSTARHTTVTFYDDLIRKAIDWLTIGGTLQMVLPLGLADYILKQTKDTDLVLEKTICLRSFVESPPFRKIISLRKRGLQDVIVPEEHYFTLYQNRGTHSTAYRTLLQPFFLNF